MKKDRRITGEFANCNDPSYGLAYIDFAQPYFLEAFKAIRASIERDKKDLRPNIERHIYRVDKILKEQLQIIPTTEYGVEWFYKRLKLNANGLELRMITDKELIQCTEEYLAEFYSYFRKGGETPIPGSFPWNRPPQSLDELFRLLVSKDYISADSSLDSFKSLFSVTNALFHGKIKWLKRGRGGISKKSLLELFTMLDRSSIISIGGTLGKKEFSIIESYFADGKGDDIKFSYSNKPTIQDHSQYYHQTLELIQELNKAYPKP